MVFAKNVEECLELIREDNDKKRSIIKKLRKENKELQGQRTSKDESTTRKNTEGFLERFSYIRERTKFYFRMDEKT